MKQRINLRLSLIALIAILATAVGVTLVYYSLFQRQVQDDLKLNARLLVETGVFRETSGQENKKADRLDRLSSGNLRITWIDGDGTVLFDNDTDISALPNHLDRPEIRQAFEAGEGKSTRRSDTMNMNTFYYALLLEDGTVLRLSTQARAITSVLLTALPVIGTIAAVILLVCVLIGHLLTGQLLRPIGEMAENLEDGERIPVYKELEPFARKIRSQHESILAAAKSRQDFTANVSHELKTPITAISGYAELVENHLVAEEQAPRIAGDIRRNAERLQSLISDIIQLSELDHKEVPRSFVQMDLFAVARDCVEEYRPMARQRNVRLNISGSSAGLYGDRGLIQELINNLIQNAIRYNRNNGWVMVRVSIENEHPILRVMDNGIGIPQEHQDRVFERFYRVDKSRSRETGGTGLGLAIVKHIADIHSADITLDSVPEKGTVMTVRF